MWAGGLGLSGNFEVQYVLQSVSPLTDTSWTTATSTQTASPYTVTGLTRNTNYRYRVRKGSGAWSNTLNVRTDDQYAPVTLTAGPGTTTTMPLRWSGGEAPNDADVRIEWKKASETNWDGHTIRGTTGVATATSYTVMNLDADISYNFRVRRDDANSDWSGTATTSTLSHTAPVLSLTQKTSATVALSWTAGDCYKRGL